MKPRRLALLDFCWPKGRPNSLHCCCHAPCCLSSAAGPQLAVSHAAVLDPTLPLILWCLVRHRCSHPAKINLHVPLPQEYFPTTKRARGPAKASPAKARAHNPPKPPKQHKKMQQQLPSRKSPPARARAEQQPPAARGQKGKQQPASMYSRDYKPSTDDDRPKKHAGARGRGRSSKPTGTKRRASAVEGRRQAPTAAATDAGKGKGKAAAIVTGAGKGRQKAAAAAVGTRPAEDEGEQEGSRRVRSRRDEEVRHSPCSCSTAWDVVQLHPAPGALPTVNSSWAPPSDFAKICHAFSSATAVQLLDQAELGHCCLVSPVKPLVSTCHSGLCTAPAPQSVSADGA